ncbi:MAG TPA: hypothetical protein VIZ68_07215 [Thermoplasmata archaeon]
MGPTDPRPSGRRLLVLLIALVVAAAALPTPADGAGFPELPLGSDGGFLYDLNAPVLAPGGSGPLTLSLGNPLGVTISSVRATLALYAFNAYPGNATGGLPADAPTLSVGGQVGATVTLDAGDLASGSSSSFSVSIDPPAGCPSGTFALRTSVEFTINGTAYRLESRGFFSDALWASATDGPNRTSTLNLTVLGVSGVVPETGVLVRANPYPPVLYVVLAVAFVLAGAGGYYAWRRGPRSRSGARDPEPPSQAPSALGKRRTSDGD